MKDVHELLRRLIDLNLPQPDVSRIYKKWIPEVATGFKRMEIKEEDIEYNPAWEKDRIKIVGELLPLKARLPALREGFTPFPSSAGFKSQAPYPAELITLRAIFIHHLNPFH